MEINYFKINLNEVNYAGISHQNFNFHTLIKYCYKNNLKLIKPIFKLTKNHNKHNNNDLISDLSEYYDLNNIKVNGEIFKLYDDNINIIYTIDVKSYHENLLINDSLFCNLPNVSVNIPYILDIYNIANIIADKLNNDYMCIHVRRGDRMTNNQIDIDTQPTNIQKIIENYQQKNIYIMTNRKEELNFIYNTDNYKIYFYSDFECLNNIQNNYYLFCIENVIMDMAKIRCSTFNTQNNYYNCYLTNYPGWMPIINRKLL